MTYLFLDTNIFLHYSFFTEIPWKEVIGDDFKLMIAPVVLSELDKHKRHPQTKIANRAKRVLIRIEEIEASPENYPLSCMLKRPKAETFVLNQLDPKEQDDAILASILDFIDQHPYATVKFITNDTGPRLRSGSLGLTAVRLPEQYLLAEEKSEDQKLIDKLTKENSILKNRIPKLALLFKDETTFFKREIVEFNEDRQEYVNRKLEERNSGLITLVYEDPKKKQEDLKKASEGKSNERLANLFLNSQLNFNMATKEQVSKYNTDLENYRQEYRLYLEKKFKQKKLIKLSFPLEISLFNTGNVPAEDIDIWMHFPDGFNLVSLKDFPKKPKEPALPHRPTSKYDALLAAPMIDIGSIVNNMNRPASIPMPDFNPNRLSIRKTNSYEVELSHPSLKHFQSHKLDPLIVVFGAFKEIINFSIDYKLVVGNMPEPVIGKLNVHIDKKCV